MVNVTCHRLARGKVTFAKCVRRDALRHATSRVAGRRPTPVARATSSDDAPRDLGTHSHARTGLNLNFDLSRKNGRVRKSGKFNWPPRGENAVHFRELSLFLAWKYRWWALDDGYGIPIHVWKRDRRQKCFEICTANNSKIRVSSFYVSKWRPLKNFKVLTLFWNLTRLNFVSTFRIFFANSKWRPFTNCTNVINC